MTGVQVSRNKDHQKWETVQRVVFPDAHDSSVWPLYVDWGSAPSSAALSEMKKAGIDSGPPSGLPVMREPAHIPSESTRRSVTIKPGEHLALATYFNAFPAAYWQRWTDVKRVKLVIDITGKANVSVLRSTVRGTFNKVTSSFGEGHFSFEIPLQYFGDGGWIWPEIEAGDEEVTLVEAHWEVPVVREVTKAKVTIGITTFNLAEECVAQANRFAAEPEVLERISQIVIVDQGTRHVVDEPGYAEVKALLGDKLRVIEQDNLGGSGGFSRGMYEAVADPESQYVLLSDDDAQVEPEGVLRAISFAEHTYKPVIVGGHMLNLYERTVLHSMGEIVSTHSFFWESVYPSLSNVDFAQRTIRTDPMLNVRLDVSYNGWWMCLIPTSIIEQIGLSLPIFIKWDDAEYGLRASEQGFPTVTLPGMAAWHAPWNEKDDRNDWQAYFHQRNRWVAALMHSPAKKGGGLPVSSFKNDVNHILSYEYYAETLRLKALEDVLQGPSHLVPSLLSRASDARKAAKTFENSQLMTDPQNYPVPQRIRETARKVVRPRNHTDLLFKVLKGAIRQLQPVDPGSQDRPVEAMTSVDKVWWRLVGIDSALVSNSQGSGVWFYRRSRARYINDTVRSIRLHRQLISRWDELAREYRASAKELSSIDSWKQVWGI